jgi:hypothetical protein
MALQTKTQTCLILDSHDLSALTIISWGQQTALPVQGVGAGGILHSVPDEINKDHDGGLKP